MINHVENKWKEMLWLFYFHEKLKTYFVIMLWLIKKLFVNKDKVVSVVVNPHKQQAAWQNALTHLQ